MRNEVKVSTSFNLWNVSFYEIAFWGYSTYIHIHKDTKGPKLSWDAKKPVLLFDDLCHYLSHLCQSSGISPEYPSPIYFGLQSGYRLRSFNYSLTQLTDSSSGLVTRRAVESEDFELAQKLKQQEQDSEFQLGK